MAVYITDESARAFWNGVESLDGQTSRMQVASLADSRATVTSIASYGIPRSMLANRKLHVLVGQRSDRRYSKHIVPHVCDGLLPPDAFRQVSESVMVASPELLFVRMARKLPMHELIQLGFELSGTYVVEPANPDRRDRDPLTSVTKLRDFAGQVCSMRGHRRALTALKYVIEGSNSPMETVVAMLLCLPSCYGGFGLPRPCMNQAVKLEERRSQLLGLREYRCDLLWEDSSYALEYYGREWHTGVDQVAYDARRQNELQYLGIEVAIVTFEQLETPEQVEDLARKVAKKLCVRFRKPTLAQIGARAELHRYLIGRHF